LFSTIKKGATPLDGVARGINKSGEFTGAYCEIVGGNHVCHGYLGKNAIWRHGLSIFNSPSAGAGVNDSGVVVGSFKDSNGYYHGFILNNGTTTRVDFPDPTEQMTILEGINDSGLVTGVWYDNNGSGPSHAFKLDTTTNTFTPIEVKGSTSQVAWGVNNAGLVAIQADTSSYIYCPRKPTKCPGTNAFEVPDERGITARSGVGVETRFGCSWLGRLSPPAKHRRCRVTGNWHLFRRTVPHSNP